jgi:hypothetical protein
MEIQELFSSYRKKSESGCRRMYIEKTEQRIEQLLNQDSYWGQLMAYDEIIVNGKKLKNYKELLQLFEKKLNTLAEVKDLTIIHGDFCFSNILYDFTNQIGKFIDPRGSFEEPGIYGDQKYDLAKLRHSISGAYDFIVGDLFYLENTDNSFNIELLNNEHSKQLTEYLDTLIDKMVYDVSSIKLIEGLLFLTMIPYHSDYPQRQKMMYLQGLKILNELCE